MARNKKPEQSPEKLKEIRENYDWAAREWGPIHKEGNMDVRFIAGDPWDERDVQARDQDEQKRPHLVFDEGSQYVNMFCGQAMQQKRAPKVDPVDDQANAEDAKILQGRMMHIEYASRGLAHSIKGLSDAATRGYGWISLRKKYSNPEGREQEPCFNPVANPDSRLMDPNAKEPDGSDAEFCFVRDVVKKSTVLKKWPFAKNLGDDSQKTITLVEYWKVDSQPVDCIYWLGDGNGDDVEVRESALPQGTQISDTHITIGGRKLEILDEREIEERIVTKYICQILDASTTQEADDPSAMDTVEILEIEPWDGNFIPEIPVLGQEYYINQGGTVKRTLLSLLRRARDPMQLLNLTRTNEAELVAMTPKTRFLGYEGQFEGHENEFKNIGTSPLAFLQVKGLVDPMSNQVLPLPIPVRWEPPIQALELLAQSCQNAIRSAIGQLASPELDKTESGVALDKIRQSGESAVYYLVDHYEISLQQVGRVMGDLIERTHDTKRDIPVRNATEEQEIITVNAPYDRKRGKKTERANYKFPIGGFSYTMTTGPSYQSQFQQASEFVDLLVSKMPVLLVDGQGHSRFGDLLVRLKNMGPVGDQIMERFKRMLPPGWSEEQGEVPPEVEQEMQKAQQVIDALTQQVDQLKTVIESKQLELQSEEKRAEWDNKTKLAIAEINAQVKENIHELTMSMNQIAMTMKQQWDAMHGERSHEQELERATQAAALQPPPPPAGGGVATVAAAEAP